MAHCHQIVPWAIQVDRFLPVGFHDGKTNDIGRDRSGTEALHSKVVDEAAM
jgi:hypothetical protein